MKDTKLKLSYLTILLLNTLIGRILDILSSAEISQAYPMIKKLIEIVTKEHGDLSEVLNSPRGSRFTEKLKECDAIRGDAFISLREYIYSASRRRKKKEIRDAALKISPYFKKHGNTLYKLGYSDLTGKMNQFQADLETPELQAAIDAAKARELYEEMVEAQQQFEQLYQVKITREKPDEKLKRTNLLPALKFHLILLIRNIIFLAETGDTVFTQIDRKVGEAVRDIMIIAKTRRSRSEIN